jgi:hypothetical protein
LKKHFSIDKHHVISTSAKYVCAGDVLIDDKLENLKKWVHCNPNGLAIRWLGPANRFENWNFGPSTDSWADAIVMIKNKGVNELERRWRTHE